MSKKRPNLLFLFSDQHAQKVTGCYGDEIVSTPALDRLAARGVAFDNAYTPSPLCTPARMSVLTGRYPCRQRCWTNSDALASDIPTTAHAAGVAGYRPALVGRLHSIGPDQLHGYVRREVGDHSTNWIGGVPHSLGVLERTNDPFRVSIEKSGPGQSSYELHDDDVATAACGYLDELADARRSGDSSPFALTVGLMLPHQPYVARPEHYARYDGRIEAPRLPAPERDHPYLAWWREHTGIRDLDREHIIRARTAYYALVTTLDGMVARILERLEANGLAENTLVVYSSDHGDQIGERGLWWKQTFYDESAKVPLIVAWPGALPEGERRSQVVNLVDLAATIADALGAPGLPAADGVSLLSVACDATLPWHDETFSEYCTDGMSPWTGVAPLQQRMVRNGRWKLNYYHGARPQLFDLDSDPHELDDLAETARHATIRDQLTERVLADWDPESIAATMASRRVNKEYLRDWSQSVKPEDSYRWAVRMEDNWLEPRERREE